MKKYIGPKKNNKNKVMKKSIILLIATTSFFVYTASAQKNAFTLIYNYGALGSKDLKDFIDNDSWRGWQFEYQYFFSPKFAVGGISGFQGFYEKRPRETYVNGNTSVNAVTWRYFTNVPLLPTVKYYFIEEGFRPYVGGGIGMSFSSQEIQVGDYLDSENRANFALMVEGGLRFDFGTHWAGVFSAKYNYAAYNPDDFDTDNIGYLTVGLGVLFTF